MTVEVVVGGGRPQDVGRLLEALEARLTPAGSPFAPRPALPPLVPVPPGTDPDQARAELEAALVRPVPPGTAVLLRTSGSTTGRGHVVALTPDALLSSASATHDRLGGPGRWFLAVPAHHVAGLQILTRSYLARLAPAVLDTSAGFDPGALAALVDATLDADAAELARRTAAERARAEACTPFRRAIGRGYLSLVPTQLVRALQAGPEVHRALARLDAILVGGAAVAPDVLHAAHRAGIRVVRTYGMTETGGGCVYDGRPLDGVTVDVDAEARVWISGPVLAAGYLDDDAAHAAAFTGGRLRTTDAGELTAGGHLTVLGRLDDAITTGGQTVAPAAVERVLAGLPGVAECAVVGVPDPEWGESVTAVVVPSPGTPVQPGTLLASAREAARGLSAAHAPRGLVLVERMPLRGPGKIDRRAVAALARGALTGEDSGAAPGPPPGTHDAGPRVLGTARHAAGRGAGGRGSGGGGGGGGGGGAGRGAGLG